MRKEHKEDFLRIVAEVGGFSIDKDSLTATLAVEGVTVIASARISVSNPPDEYFNVTVIIETKTAGVFENREDPFTSGRFKRALEAARALALSAGTGGT